MVRSIDDRWEARELFFWTVRQALSVVILATFVIYSVVAVAAGHVPLLDQLIPLLGR